ncbi:immunoglobulin superfamily member 10-like isoform X3 [Heptranchias perlo]|uniref:immunoglobulin superfamily member 10-like isoform X3 n=1 Tax=Heptranchias perlo TaxID=212740 RepID=UPI0035596668
MERSRLTAFAVCFLISSGQPHPFTVLVNQNVINATAGDSVVLSVRPSSPVSSGFWKFGTASIVAWTVEPPDLNIAYTKRNVELLFNTSLLLRSVALSDSGDYWVTMDSPAGKVATAKITLNVFRQPHPFTVLVNQNVINATAGDSVVLSVRPSSPVSSGFWKFGTASIVAWTVEPPDLNIAYTKRNVELLFNTSLLLRSVALSDSGDYWVTMDSPAGKVATAKITLNVFPKPDPFTIYAKCNEVNSTTGDTVLLSVAPSEEVKNGKWIFGGNVIAHWMGAFPEVNADYIGRAVVLTNASLQLKSVSASDTGEYSVTMSTASGNTRTAKLHLNVLNPFTIYAKCNEVNSTTGDTVLLSVVPSEEVKNGTWTFGGNVVAHWMGASPEVNPDYRGRAAVLTNASLQLKSVSVSDTGEYSVTMSTASGDTRTAKLYLNVFIEPQPFTISMALSEINAEIGASVLMSVIVSGEVKNGSWAIGSRILFKWEGTIQNITDFTRYYKELLPNASLLLKSVQFYNRGRYKVTLESSSGVTATANVTLNVYSTHRMCTMYNTTLTLSVLLALICIFAFAILILKKHQTVGYETNDLLTVLCKGYRVCLSFVTVLAFNLILIFAIVIHKNVCAPGQRPVINFLAK